jgi:hypothetical protein
MTNNLFKESIEKRVKDLDGKHCESLIKNDVDDETN